MDESNQETISRESGQVDGPFWATVILCVIAFAYMEWLSISQFLTGRWYLADVGNIHYSLINTLRGRFMFSPMTQTNHFAFHFTPFLLLLSPITFLSRYPIPLVTSYVLALALCPLPILQIVRRSGGSGYVGVALGACFLLNHFTGSIMYAAHFEAWLILFMLCMIATSMRRGWGVFVWAVLALSVKEDATIWVAAFAAYMWWTGRDKRGKVLVALAVVWGIISVATIYLVGRNAPANATFYAERAGGFVARFDSLWLALVLLASFAFLPLAGGRAALLLLVPAPVLCVKFPFMRQLLYYYSYPFLPFLVFSAAIGAVRVHRFLVRKMSARASTALVILLVLVAGAIQAPLATRTDDYRRIPFKVSVRDKLRREVASEKIPEQSTAVVQFGLFGITPTVREALPLGDVAVPGNAYVFVDLKAAYGMPAKRFVEIVRPIFADVEGGKRKLIFERDEMYIISPEYRNGQSGEAVSRIPL